MSPCRSRRACGSRPVVGSSRNTTSGKLTNASASASRWRWPPDSVSNGASALSISAKRSSSGSGADRRRVEPAIQRQRLTRGDLVLQRGGLQRGADLLLHLARPLPRVDPAHLQPARVRFAQPDQAFDGGRLAGAVRSEQAENLARLDLEADAVDGGDAVVLFPEVVNDDVWHGDRGTRYRGYIRAAWTCAGAGSSSRPPAGRRRAAI